MTARRASVRAFATYPDDDVNLMDLGAFRQRRESDNLHRIRRQIRQLSGFRVVKVMVGLSIGVENDPFRLHNQFLDQPLLREEPERVVDGGTRGFGGVALDLFQQLLCCYVYRLTEQ